jgi:hypothetical protein
MVIEFISVIKHKEQNNDGNATGSEGVDRVEGN